MVTLFLAACAPPAAVDPEPSSTFDDSAPPPFTATPTASAPPGWVSGTDLPFPRQEHGVVALDGLVVVVAGVDDGPVAGTWVQAYDPVSEAWSDLPGLPDAVHHPNVAVVDGVMFVLGALDPAFQQHDTVMRLEPGASAWEPVASPPEGRLVGAAGVAVLGGQVHLIGGLHDRSTVALHSVYDPQSDTWAQLPDAPSARDHLAAGTIDGEIVVAAGRSGGLANFVIETERYTTEGGWQAGAAIPTPRGGVAAAVLDGRLHVLGGEGSTLASGVFAEQEAYDPATDTWESLADMPSPRHGMGAAVVDQVLWVPGGAPVDQFGAEAVMQGVRE